MEIYCSVFKKNIGESLGAQLYSSQPFEYGLTLGGMEKMYKYFDRDDDLTQLGFNSKFKTEEEVIKAVTIKSIFESLTNEMVNKYNYTKKQIKNLIIVSNTDAIQVYDYEVINNQLTELNIYSSGAEQLARNKKSIRK